MGLALAVLKSRRASLSSRCPIRRQKEKSIYYKKDGNEDEEVPIRRFNPQQLPLKPSANYSDFKY